MYSTWPASAFDVADALARGVRSSRCQDKLTPCREGSQTARGARAVYKVFFLFAYAKNHDVLSFRTYVHILCMTGLFMCV